MLCGQAEVKMKMKTLKTLKILKKMKRKKS